MSKEIKYLTRGEFYDAMKAGKRVCAKFDPLSEEWKPLDDVFHENWYRIIETPIRWKWIHSKQYKLTEDLALTDDYFTCQEVEIWAYTNKRSVVGKAAWIKPTGEE